MELFFGSEILNSIHIFYDKYTYPAQKFIFFSLNSPDYLLTVGPVICGLSNGKPKIRTIHARRFTLSQISLAIINQSHTPLEESVKYQSETPVSGEEESAQLGRRRVSSDSSVISPKSKNRAVIGSYASDRSFEPW